MNYKEYTIRVSDQNSADIMVAELAELGFDSFSEFECGRVQCYITDSEFESNASEIEEYLDGMDVQIKQIEQQNWNALWESNFEPIALGDMCYIRAPFHSPATGKSLYEIIIMPKMSFGTGHHPTTYLMVESILRADLKGKNGLDMGSGTGILAILAAKCGARHVDAIDIDEWAWENCNENKELNGVASNVEALLGDAALLDDRPESYDFILANINRNILLRDMPQYVRAMKPGATIIFSGFLEFDIEAIKGRARELGLKIQCQTLRQGWASITAQL